MGLRTFDLRGRVNVATPPPPHPPPPHPHPHPPTPTPTVVLLRQRVSLLERPWGGWVGVGVGSTATNTAIVTTTTATTAATRTRRGRIRARIRIRGRRSSHDRQRCNLDDQAKTHMNTMQRSTTIPATAAVLLAATTGYLNYLSYMATDK